MCCWNKVFTVSHSQKLLQLLQLSKRHDCVKLCKSSGCNSCSSVRKCVSSSYERRPASALFNPACTCICCIKNVNSWCIWTSAGLSGCKNHCEFDRMAVNAAVVGAGFTSSQPQHLKHIKNTSLARDLLTTPSVLRWPRWQQKQVNG